jgi:hypothetical protein
VNRGTDGATCMEARTRSSAVVSVVQGYLKLHGLPPAETSDADMRDARGRVGEGLPPSKVIPPNVFRMKGQA